MLFFYHFSTVVDSFLYLFLHLLPLALGPWRLSHSCPAPFSNIQPKNSIRSHRLACYERVFVLLLNNSGSEAPGKDI